MPRVRGGVDPATESWPTRSSICRTRGDGAPSYIRSCDQRRIPGPTKRRPILGRSWRPGTGCRRSRKNAARSSTHSSVRFVNEKSSRNRWPSPYARRVRPLRVGCSGNGVNPSLERKGDQCGRRRAAAECVHRAGHRIWPGRSGGGRFEGFLSGLTLGGRHEIFAYAMDTDGGRRGQACRVFRGVRYVCDQVWTRLSPLAYEGLLRLSSGRLGVNFGAA